MSTLQNITATDFKNALTLERVRSGMVIQAALGLGALFYFAAILMIVSSHDPQDVNPESLDFLTTLTIANFSMFIVFAGTGHFLYRSRLTRTRVEAALAGENPGHAGDPFVTPAENLFSFIRTAMLIRTATFEASTFFGLAVLIIAATDGLLGTTSWLWINAFPLAALMTLIVSTFPTAERLQSIFESLQNVA